MTPPSSRTTAFWVGALLVLALFSLPLLFGLNEPEMRSDEAIYSYAVERILDTGHWLTAHSIPTDEPFLEKPPLKFWITAAGIRSGLLPNNDMGLRWFDGLFGAIGFFYVFLIGCRMSGPTCGVVAVLALFTLDPLVFEHGLRSNNMEASVFLSYCGGLYHFMRWVEGTPGRARRGQAFAVAGYFVLGFMTKFVAAAFLPMIGLVSLLWRRGGLTTIKTGWRDWILPVVAVLAVTAPWFIYESRLYGSGFWQIIFGVHVFKRFTSWLDPSHLHPWHYYFSWTWREVTYAREQILIALGLARLAVAAVRGETWTSRVVLVWGLLPLSLMSIGTSKLGHYAYPFWPPVGLGAGLAFAWVLGDLERRIEPAIVARLARFTPTRAAAWSVPRSRTRTVLLSAAGLLLALALWTLLVAPVRLEIGGVELFRNSSFLRPAFVAVVLFWLAGQSRTMLRLSTALAMAFLLPLMTYMEKIHRIGRVDHPIRAARDCIAAVEGTGAPVGHGVYDAAADLHHAYYFYLGRIGPWVVAPQFSLDDTLARLTVPGQQTPVIIQRPDYETLAATVPPLPVTAPDAPPPPPDEYTPLRATLTKGAVTFDDNVAMLLPGPFQACAAPMLAADGHAIWKRPAPVKSQ
jgi:4-amino-4-deoxy-L-arabinose transferase-like glycosyltransferase